MFKTMYKIFKLAGPLKGKYILSLFLGFFESAFANFPLAMILVGLYAIIDNTLDETLCIWLFLGLVFGIVMRGIFKYYVNANQQGSGYIIFADERKKLAERLKRFPMGYYSKDGTGTINSVLTSDLLHIEDAGIGAMGNFLASFLGAIVSLIFVTVLDIRIGLILTFFMILCALLIILIRKKSISGAFVMQERQLEMTSSVIEYIKGMPIIKAFNLVEGNHKKSSVAFSKFRDIQLSYEMTIINIMIFTYLVSSLGTSYIIYASGNFEYNLTLAIPLAILCIMMSFQIFAPVMLMMQTVATISIAADGLERYEKLLDLELIDEDGKDIELSNFDIEFKDVKFGYSNQREILHGINFKVKQGTMTALVGRSGSGKSTIVNLLARFWDVSDGSILIGNHNIKELNIDSLYKNISMVFQKVYLFNDSIYNNIVFGKKDASKQEVEDACKKARCHDFIMALENGYDTVLAEGGNTLSGGEKQRISIARAILKDAPIVLLDEATASIDPENEAFIQQAINELVKSKTLIVIAHKLSSIKFANQILVIDDGNIVESGTHDQLLLNDKEYAKLWKLRQKSQSWEIK